MIGHHAPAGTVAFDLKAGEYIARGGRFIARTPNGVLVVLDKRWTWEEHEDESMTVTPSIDVKGEAPWHGWLRRGIWSEA